MPQSAGHSFHYKDTIRSSVPGRLYDLFHRGTLTVGGRELRLGEAALPTPIRETDHIRWVFKSPVKVSTPGPDSSIQEIKQYRDRITLAVWPWATIEIKVIE